MSQIFLDQIINKNVIEEVKNYLNNKSIICYNCGSNEYTKYGFRSNSSSKIRVYKCKRCNKKFSNVITRKSNQELWVHDVVLDLAVNGVNPSEIIEQVKKLAKMKEEEVQLSKNTILNMLKFDSQFLSTIERNMFHKNLAKTWEIDETFEHLPNKDKCYVFNIKSVETKYWLVSFASFKRNKIAQSIALSMAFNRASYAPNIIRSDGFAPNLKDFNGPMKHVKVESISKKIDYSCINNVERINGVMRELIKKNSCVYSIEHLQSLVELKRLHYNFLRKHISFPQINLAYYVGIDLPIKSWIDLFRIADYFDRRKT